MVVAFGLGRLWNQLRFHMIQAWFEPVPSSHRDAASRVARVLGQKARFLKSTAVERERIELTVEEAADLLLDAIDEAWYEQTLDYILSGFNIVDVDLLWDNLCKDHLKRVFGTLDSLREDILAGRDDRHRLAMGLGEVVDQGLRRRDILRQIVVWRADPVRELGRADGGGLPHFSLRRPCGGEGVPVPRFLFRKSGELPPDVGWLDRVRQRALELGIAPNLLAGESHEGGRTGEQEELHATNVDYAAIVDGLDGSIYTALASDFESSSGRPGSVQVVAACRGTVKERLAGRPDRIAFSRQKGRPGEWDGAACDERATSSGPQSIREKVDWPPPDGDGEPPRPCSGPGEKKRGIPREQANHLVNDCLEKNPGASIRKLSKATGVSLGGISKTPAWKAEMAIRKEARGPVIDRRCRQLTERILRNIGHKCDLSTAAETIDLVQRKFLESASPKEKGRFYAANEDEQTELLRLYVAQMRDEETDRLVVDPPFIDG
jgi:hypothetical protein